MLKEFLPQLIELGVIALVAFLAVFFTSKNQNAKAADTEADRLITHLQSRLTLVEQDRDDCRKLIAKQEQEVKELREKLAYLEGLVRGRDEGGVVSGEVSIRGMATPS